MSNEAFQARVDELVRSGRLFGESVRQARSELRAVQERAEDRDRRAADFLERSERAKRGWARRKAYLASPEYREWERQVLLLAKRRS